MEGLPMCGGRTSLHPFLLGVELTEGNQGNEAASISTARRADAGSYPRLNAAETAALRTARWPLPSFGDGLGHAPDITNQRAGKSIPGNRM